MVYFLGKYFREIVSEDIQDFEYTPSAKYPGLFQVVNVENEQQLLKRFIHHIQVEILFPRSIMF